VERERLRFGGAFSTTDGETAAARNLNALQIKGSVQILYLLRKR